MLYVYLSSVIQVVAESFPISSSGHCTLLERVWEKIENTKPWLMPPHPWSDTFFFERFLDVLHVVPLVIVAVYFSGRWSIFVRHPLSTWRIAVRLVGYAALAGMMTGFFYVMRSYDYVGAVPLWIGFALTTACLLSLIYLPTGTVRLNVWRALVLGFFQGIPLLIPGVSRFAVTFFGARVLGFSLRHSLEVSFMIQWPLMLAAATRSVLFFAHGARGVFLHPLFWLVLMSAALIAWCGFVYAARLALTGRLWLFGMYTFFMTFVAVFLA